MWNSGWPHPSEDLLAGQDQGSSDIWVTAFLPILAGFGVKFVLFWFGFFFSLKILTKSEARTYPWLGHAGGDDTNVMWM